MSEYKKYMHVERLGSAEVDGITHGECYVFPKIDGSNAKIWFDWSGIKYGSRNRELSVFSDNQGFVAEQTIREYFYNPFFGSYPNYVLYGEWLVPHSLRTYQDSAWRKFYVFDVFDINKQEYLHYNEYSPILEHFGIEFVPPIAVIKNPSDDFLYKLLEKNTYLIKDGQGFGEGIVIKNYDFKNKYGRTIWAKIVSNEFKAKHNRAQPTVMKDRVYVEQKIVDKYITNHLVEKEFNKIENWSSKKIPQLLNTVFYCLIKEESWNFVKENKNPTIDYKRLMNLTIIKIKEIKPEIF